VDLAKIFFHSPSRSFITHIQILQIGIIKRKFIVGFCVVIICLAVAIPIVLQTQNPMTQRQVEAKNAVDKAINFIKDTHEASALLMLDVMHRQFGVSEFENALQRYDQIMAQDTRNAPYLRVFRHIAVHNNLLQSGDMQTITNQLDALTVPALYCDQTPLPANYADMLNQALDSGGYMVTHALLACIWIQDNGGQVPIDINRVYQATAALITDDSVVNDVKIEAAAFLYTAGQGALVKDSFIQRVLETQQADGGWLQSSDIPSGSYWHTTVVGLMLLLHIEYPKASYPPMLAP
jgi:hypothetical protein